MAENRFLKYKEGVKRTPAIDRTVQLLDSYFDGCPSWVTSGLRSPEDQVAIIMEKAKRHGISGDFQEFSSPDIYPAKHELIDGKPLFWWQRTWSKLLSLGDIVNPPLPAECLSDYFRPGSHENKKGQIIPLSPHQRGLAFDIGGQEDLLGRAKRVMKAFQSGECFIVEYLVENVNNALHCDVRQIG